MSVDARNAQRLLEATPGALARALVRFFREGGQVTKSVMQDEIARRAKQPTGQLAGSIDARITSTGVTVSPTKDYAPFVDQPTRPHEIRPRNKKALAFASKRIETPLGTVTAALARTRQPRGGPAARLVVAGPFLPGGQFRSQGKGRGRPDVAGSLAVVKGVMHPGHPGLGFVKGTAERVQPLLQGLLDRIAADELQRVQGGGR